MQAHAQVPTAGVNAQVPMTSLAVSAYEQLSEIDHILKRPDMFISTLNRDHRFAKCLNIAEMKIVQKQVLTSEAEEQTAVEIFGNAADNFWRSRELGINPGHIEVNINEQWVSVKNFGANIPVAQKENGAWVPFLIFGHLRTSSNYDDTKKRYLIGKNGFGAKIVNIFARIFIIECADPQRCLLYKQTWQNNMSQVSEPEITQYTGPGYTQISYSLDFPRFGVTGFDQEIMEIYAAHCAAISYTCSDPKAGIVAPVYFNGQKLEIKELVDYAGLFHQINRASAISYKDPKGSYDLCIIDAPENAVCVSFVNGIVTSNGGVHVDEAYRVVVKAIIEFMGKAADGIQITKRDIVNHVSLFISCRIDQPKFTSQIKDVLKSPKISIELPENLLKGIKKWNLIQTIYSEIERKQMVKLKKTDGKRKRRPRTEKAEPANFAGGKRAMETTLILTEGDSADSYRLGFISEIPNGQGRNFFGSLPLHGKLLNVLNADFMQIVAHKDLEAIKANLGLKEETDYSKDENYRKLNYGSLLIMPDPDNDGKHILGLILLFFLHRFPGLVHRGFIKFLRIPVVRVTIEGQRYSFYSMSSFKRFIAQVPPGARMGKPEYFKGLGSSEDHHIKEDFANPRYVTFKVDEATGEKILLAFHKTGANLRKQWIADWVNREVLDTDNYTELPISIFIDHEFIDYSIENIIRSIPEAMDGMKESQRKVYFAAMKKMGGKKKKDKVKVAQIGSHAAEITNYKHGETCLSDTIVQMTYGFVGSNNMSYFQPRAQLGCVDPNTPVLCWDGSIKYAKDITTADILVGDDGNPRHISMIVGGVDIMYDIIQNYGAPYRVNSQHILTLCFPNHKKIFHSMDEIWTIEYFDINRKDIQIISDNYDQILKLAETIPDNNIFDIDIQTYLSFFSPDKRNLFRSTHNTHPIQWPKVEVPVDPYEFGRSLSDEDTNKYVINDIETRLKLLAGIIDEGGNLKSDFFELSGKSKHVIDTAEYVAKSLGFKVLKTGANEVLHISGDINRIPTKLSRNYVFEGKYDSFLGDKIQIKCTGVGQYVGWHIDGNERFLLGDFTVTHNTRNKGGKDAAQPRYACVGLPWWCHLIYRKEDKRLEKLIEDEGDDQECENFFPILPMHLVNGVIGIGTAYSTNIPQHNPLDISLWLMQRLLQDLQPEAFHQLPLLRPWYKGFTGQITPLGNGFTTEGRMRINMDQTVVIDELPIGTWTKPYEDFLNQLEEEGKISGFDTFSTKTDVKFVIHKYLDGVATPKKLKLISKHSYNNMTVLYRTPDRGIQPKIYNDIVKLLQDFYTIRLAKYVERKILMLTEFDRDIHNLSEKARFIHAVAVTKILEVRDRPEVDVHADMTQMGFNHKLLDDVNLRAVNRDRIPALLAQIEKKKNDKAALELVSPQTMWYNELEEFVTHYCRTEKCSRSSFESCNPDFTITIGK